MAMAAKTHVYSCTVDNVLQGVAFPFPGGDYGVWTSDRALFIALGEQVTLGEEAPLPVITWEEALGALCSIARRSLGPDSAERLHLALTLLSLGAVSEPEREMFVVQDSLHDRQVVVKHCTCECEDARRAPSGFCAHRLAVWLYARACILAPAQPTPMEESVVAEQTRQLSALPEAPVSANFHIVLAGRQVQFTLRDTNESRLLQRLEALLARFPVPVPPPSEAQTPAKSDKSWCALHQVQMKEQSNDRGRWFSHRTDDGWCRGKAAR